MIKFNWSVLTGGKLKVTLSRPRWRVKFNEKLFMTPDQFRHIIQQHEQWEERENDR